jgi:hypothetical protein
MLDLVDLVFRVPSTHFGTPMIDQDTTRALRATLPSPSLCPGELFWQILAVA